MTMQPPRGRPKQPPTRTLCVTLPAGLYETLRTAAERDDRTTADYVRRLIERTFRCGSLNQPTLAGNMQNIIYQMTDGQDGPVIRAVRILRQYFHPAGGSGSSIAVADVEDAETGEVFEIVPMVNLKRPQKSN